MRQIVSTIFPLLVTWNMWSCSDAVFQGGGKKSEKKGGNSEEDEKADPPTEVSGSWLCDWVEEVNTAPGETSKFGCSVFANGKPVDRNERQFLLTLHQDKNTPLKMDTEDTPATSAHVKYGHLPTENNHSGFIQMIVVHNGKTEFQLTMNTSEIGSSERLSATADSVDLSKGPLLSLRINAVWRGGDIGFTGAGNKLFADDFCDTGGLIRAEIKSAAVVDLIESTAEGLGLPTPSIKIEATTSVINSTDNSCLVTFQTNTDKSQQFVHSSSDGKCLLLKVQESKKAEPELRIISLKGMAVDPATALTNVRNFARSKSGCK